MKGVGWSILVQVNIFEAKNRLSQLIKRIRAGEEVVLADRGEPVARLVPAGKPLGAASGTGSPRAILGWLESYSLPDHVRRSSEEIDASIAEERRPRE
jgi:prevent-host-death family protein